jgi:hypothetical protein
MMFALIAVNVVCAVGEPHEYTTKSSWGHCCKDSNDEKLTFDDDGTYLLSDQPDDTVCSAACDARDSCKYYAYSSLYKNCNMCSGCSELKTSSTAARYQTREKGGLISDVASAPPPAPPTPTNGSEPPEEATDDETPSPKSLYSASCEGIGNEVKCLRVAGCQYNNEVADGATKCNLIDCAAKTSCEDCAYAGCGWQLDTCQDVPGGSKQGEDPCPVQDVSCWTKADMMDDPVTGFCTVFDNEQGTSASASTGQACIQAGITVYFTLFTFVYRLV